MSGTPTVLVDDGPLSGGASFADALVARLHAEYGVDCELIRSLVTEALGTFVSARVQTFVPILVEKRLRETCRVLRALPGRRLP